MSIGIRLHDTIEGTLAQRAAYIKNQGFSCAHVALSKVLGPVMMDPAALTPGVSAMLRREMGGIDVAVLGCYLNLTTPDEAEYRETLKKYIAHLRLAAYLGGCVVGTETGNPNTAYAYEPERSHTEEALQLFIDRVRPVVRAAESLGAVLAIEPVYVHIVHTPQRARRVLDEIASPNLQIILDPVNLLHADNIARRDEIFAEAIDLLGEDVAVMHVKDYIFRDGKIVSCAAGTGEMDYTALFRFVKARKSELYMTLEDTNPQNAEAACRFVRETLKKV